jgi:HEAT repeat protein
MAGLLKTIAKRLRQVAFSFREKPPAKVDDYVLEHFLLYHGLVGTSPENQRSFRDVRQDIFSALESKSSLQLCIALKVQPLWWDDKLKTIFDQFKDKARAAEVLLPQLDDTTWPNRSDPLGHPEWVVRANAANMLAHLKHAQADDRMSRALRDTIDNGSAAFCHIAYALGKLGTDQAKEVLKEFINADEPWFRVDVAGALAATGREDVYTDLSEALFSNHPLQDYTAVAIARHRKPTQFFNSAHEIVQDGGCSLVVGLLQASKQTFNSDLINDMQLTDLLPTISQLAHEAPNPIRIRTAILLSSWIKAENQLSGRSELANEMSSISDQFNSPETGELLRRHLNPSTSEIKSWSECNQRQAIQLLGELRMESAFPDLLNMLEKGIGPLETVIQSLEDLGDVAAAKPLVTLANRLVDVQSRTNKPISKQPVAEEYEAEAKSYWQILKALGNLPAKESMTLLANATNDFAPDKREQALASLTSAFEKNSQLMPKKEVSELLKKGLSDQSAGVRVVALNGVEQLDCIELIDLVLDLFDAREISVAKQTKQTLSRLWEQGHGKKIESELQARLKKEPDEFKRKKILEFISSEKTT